MKRNLVALLVAGLGSAFSAHADGPFGETVGVNGTDVWALSCPIGTVSARARVNDGILAGNVISVQVINPHGRATTRSAVDGGGGSPDAILASGAGLYLVNVSSSTVIGLEGYTITLDCRDAFAADIAGDQSELIQDQ